MGFQWCSSLQTEMKIMLEKRPVVSIIIATYNAASLLPQTLTSLRSMADFSFELFIADGGSSGDTLSIIKKNNESLKEYGKAAGNWSVVDETIRAELDTVQLPKVFVCINWITATMRKQISRWVYQR
jgi:glycosyltransferase involved in cell wall biosynthesis